MRHWMLDDEVVDELLHNLDIKYIIQNYQKHIMSSFEVDEIDQHDKIMVEMVEIVVCERLLHIDDEVVERRMQVEIVDEMVVDDEQIIKVDEVEHHDNEIVDEIERFQFIDDEVVDDDMPGREIVDERLIDEIDEIDISQI